MSVAYTASIVRLEDGFDFLGFNIRRYRNQKLLIKPSKAAVQRIRSRLAAEVKALHGANAEAVITKLNPVIRGWAAYYRTVASAGLRRGIIAGGGSESVAATVAGVGGDGVPNQPYLPPG